MDIQDIVKQLLGQSNEEVAKAAMLTATMGSANVVELDWKTTWQMYGVNETPVISTIGRTQARAITHRFREATARAAASNASNENAAPKAAVSVAPAAKTNTCQIVKGTVGVSESSMTEAMNGIYGTDALNAIALQLQMETAGILKDIENAVLFGVESTTDPRAMKGLVGLVGTWNGVIQTTRTDNSDNAFNQTVFDNWLSTIYAAQAGYYPNKVYCSLKAAKAISAFTSAYTLNVNATDPTQLLEMTAGTRVKYYVAPWNELIEIVPHPLNSNAATSANNWMLALNTDLIKLADFRPLKTRAVLPGTLDGENWEVIWEGTLEASVESAHAILRNFDQLT